VVVGGAVVDVGGAVVDVGAPVVVVGVVSSPPPPQAEANSVKTANNAT
jgi:hypothetical protein